MPELTAAIAADGFAIVPPIVPRHVIDDLISRMADAPHAIRDLISAVPAVGDLARRPEIRGLAETILGPGAFVARAILFDKTTGANWKVAWHQDLTIAVRERREVAGFGPWSEKAGIPHVQPPVDVLERMLALRIHLDPCGPENGPLRVLPGSHGCGKLDAQAIADRRRSTPEVPCLADRGGIVILRPLLLHASSPAASPGHRRVIHLEFAAEDLPGPLEWHGRW
ncbi:MAG: hypothetical protein JWN86_4349 [Planctomycetota bacterium]|nr:hypothetical protein [Planctomycetota bacterium]